MEIFSGFILMMFMSGADVPTEFTPRESMVECLQVKRKIKRTQEPNDPKMGMSRR